LINKLIQRIERLQSKGEKRFEKGIFPSLRVNPIWGYSRADNNIFASLSVCFILKSVFDHLEEAEKAKVGLMIENVIQCLPNYQTDSNRHTYNFYRKGVHEHFPNGLLMHRFKHFKLPDDIDDTALAYVVMGLPVTLLRTELQKHAHQSGVYDTWFGINMPKEKDVCALCNLMYLVFSSDDILNANDEKTLAFLNDIIVSESFLKNPFWLSRHYGTVPLIVYHFARLIQKFDPSS
jgi:hypothetical protein